MNKVVLVGRLTKDPQLTFTAGSGKAVSKFTLAITRKFNKEETDFINCVAFGKTAETIANYLTKGRQVAIEGSIRTGSYETQDGTKRYTTDVAVESFEFIGSNGGRDNGQGNNYENEFDTYFKDDDITPVDDGEMPF